LKQLPLPGCSNLSIIKKGVHAQFENTSKRIREGEMGTDHQDDQKTHEIYWEHLAQKDPAEVCRRAEVSYSSDRKGYWLPFLNQKYLILPKERKMLCARGDFCEEQPLRDYFFLGVLLYLLNAQAGEPTRTWISEKELRGGTTFFRGPHALQVDELASVFGKNPDEFSLAGARLGGVNLLYGDKAFALTAFPKVPLAYVLWKEDEEFPARVSVLFDSTIQKHFSLDGIWCVVGEVSQRILEATQD
jgi:hypothetical protein